MLFHETIRTSRRDEMIDITRAVSAIVKRSGVADGLAVVYTPHTTAGVTIQENADPDVALDLNDHFGRLAPEDKRLYRHTVEGPDDMPAHIRAALSDVQLTIPVLDGRPSLGTWQGIYVFEHRASPHRRSVVLHLLGE